MKVKSIYLTYSHESNAGYVGRIGSLRNRFNEHCGDKRTRVQQFCDGKGVKVRDIFGMYEIIQCDKADAAYYEGHIYDLIKALFPQITLITKNKPNRSKRESNKNWRINNPEYDRIRSQKRRGQHPDYLKEYYEKTKHWIK